MEQLTSQLGSRVYLDTNIVIYSVEGYTTHATRIKSLLRTMTEGKIKVMTSDLTLAEVLVKPKRDRNTKLADAYRHFLQPTDVLLNCPITREILEAAAGIRATSVLKLPDAIHFASAINHKCDSFLTNDDRFESVPGVKVVMLSQLTVIE
ncbi:MAG TPA: type II toxin-antitoxin system VapC family toxin [Pyrinomonadaceae bacterium]|nr:type II toxin-antitoxin system VapC family toxin [Pyrinomonadaceae bacterium]